MKYLRCRNSIPILCRDWSDSKDVLDVLETLCQIRPMKTETGKAPAHGSSPGLFGTLDRFGCDRKEATYEGARTKRARSRGSWLMSALTSRNSAPEIMSWVLSRNHAGRARGAYRAAPSNAFVPSRRSAGRR